jgi:hypothetical protein
MVLELAYLYVLFHAINFSKFNILHLSALLLRVSHPTVNSFSNVIFSNMCIIVQ